MVKVILQGAMWKSKGDVIGRKYDQDKDGEECCGPGGGGKRE